MNLPEKLDKLFKTKEEDNIKLAKNIIKAKTNENNIIAFICILKKNEQFDICNEYEYIQLINKILKEKLKDYPLSSDSINYKASHLFKWALNIFISTDNINYAYDLYQNYILDVKNKAIALSEKNLEEKNCLVDPTDNLPY